MSDPATDAVLVRGGYVLTAGPQPLLRDGAVRIVGDTIVAVGPYAELATAHPDDAVHGGPHDIVTPGFVNTHGHFSEGLITGIAEQYTLWEWITHLITPVEAHLDAPMAYAGTMLAAIQMLRTGITTANDMFVVDPEPAGEPVTPAVARALDDVGLRGVLSFGAGDVGRNAPSAARLFEEHEALRTACASSRLSTFRVGIGAVQGQSPELFAASVKYAVDGGHGVHIHLQEIREEVTLMRSRHGVTSIGYCAREGLFETPVIAAHCVWVDAHDRDLLAEHQVGVAHNPVSNMILASGVCPVPELRRLGIDVGLGVDGPASNDRQDMLEVLKTTVLLQRVHSQQATAFSAAEAFEAATIGGARALRMADTIGSLEVGKKADVVVLDGSSPALANIHDPFQAVVYCAGPREVRDVWVDGRRCVRDGEACLVDVGAAVEASRPLARRLAVEAGLDELSLIAREGR